MMNNTFIDFEATLVRKLQNPLPGQQAHSRMLSSNYKQHVVPPVNARQSAVLILFYPHKGELYCPLILRSEYDGVHSGQMAFPGGRYEHFDESLIRTALREAQEEIGIRVSDIRILGTLSPIYIQVSRINVLPVVGMMSHKPEYYPDYREVQKVIDVPFSSLQNLPIVPSGQVEVRGEFITAPYYDLEGKKIWGATAMMLSELLEIIEQ